MYGGKRMDSYVRGTIMKTYFVSVVEAKDCQSSVCLSGGKKPQIDNLQSLCKECFLDMEYGMRTTGLGKLIAVKSISTKELKS